MQRVEPKPSSALVLELRKAVVFMYVNHRGEKAKRRVIPIALSFESSEWHPEEQWCLYGFDLDKNAYRSFSVKYISNWTPANDSDLSWEKIFEVSNGQEE